MQPRPILTSIPSLLIALLLAATPIAALWNATVGAANADYRIDVSHPLDGVDPEPEAAGISAFGSGAFQSFVNTSAARSLPERSFLIRLYNEIGYSILGRRHFGQVEVGAGGVLYETIYREEYCGRRLTEFEPRARHWVLMLQAIQRRLEATGKQFVYLITPSKISVYPEYLGDASCPASPEERSGLLPRYRQMLDAAGIHYLDGATFISQHRHDYEIDLWARGGTHWMVFPATLVADQLVTMIDRQLPSHKRLSNIKTTYTIDNHPRFYDVDISNLMNLLFPRNDYLVFEPTFELAQTDLAKGCEHIEISEVGGSFLNELNIGLMQARCLNLHQFFYWTASLTNYLDGTSVPTSAKYQLDEDDHKVLLRSDVVLLEENEQLLARSNHAVSLFEFLMAVQ